MITPNTERANFDCFNEFTLIVGTKWKENFKTRNKRKTLKAENLHILSSPFDTFTCVGAVCSNFVPYPNLLLWFVKLGYC